jgi:hypothetical protein
MNATTAYFPFEQVTKTHNAAFLPVNSTEDLLTIIVLAWQNVLVTSYSLLSPSSEPQVES